MYIRGRTLSLHWQTMRLYPGTKYISQNLIMLLAVLLYYTMDTKSILDIIERALLYCCYENNTVQFGKLFTS